MMTRVSAAAAFILWVGVAASPAAAAEPDRAASVPELLEQLRGSFPAGQCIPRQRFLENAAAQRLLRLAETGLGELLREYQFDVGIPVYGIMVENPASYEQFKQAPHLWRSWLRGGAAPEEHERSREAYERYLSEWRTRDLSRIQLARNRVLISMVVAEAGRRRPALVLDLLDHEDLRVQVYVIHLLRVHDGLKDPQIVAALLAKVPAELPGKELLNKPITIEDDLALQLAWTLSRWQVREALPYIRSLGNHPRYSVRMYSLHMMGRYGFREAIPHAIALLEDESYVTRGEAFTSLVKLTALDLGQNRELWGEKSTGKERASAAGEWRARWAAYRKPDDDGTFHVEVIERALRLLDLSLQGRCPEGALRSDPGYPVYLLREHLDISALGRLSDDPAERAAQLKTFWRERRSDLRFDAQSQRLVLRGQDRAK